MELTSLTAVLDRTGDDACAFEMRDPPTTLPRATTGKRVCAQVSGTTAVSPAPTPITLKWVAKAVDETQLNDGFNCPNATDPFTAPRSPPAPPLLPPSSPVGANGDPHLVLAHGGKADFRGTDKGLYNFLSAKNLSLNVMTEFADFYLHDTDHPRHKLVHGSFLTQAHVVALTGGGRTVRASYWASKIGPLNIGWINATIDNQQAFSLGPHTTKVVDDVSLHMDYSSLHVTTGEWELAVTPQAVQRSVAGPVRRIDVQMTPRVAKFSVPPHGVIGQSWDGDNKAVFGEEDEFPVRGEYTTSAMAEGAVEGVPTDYLMSSPYATDFKYSRFGLDHASPRDVSKDQADRPRRGSCASGWYVVTVPASWRRRWSCWQGRLPERCEGLAAHRAVLTQGDRPTVCRPRAPAAASSEHFPGVDIVAVLERMAVSGERAAGPRGPHTAQRRQAEPL